ARGDGRRLLNRGVSSGRVRNRTVAHAIQDRGQRVTSSADERFEERRFRVLLQQLEIATIEERCDVVEEGRFLEAVPSERVKEAACQAGFQSVLPPQRFACRASDRQANQFA